MTTVMSKVAETNPTPPPPVPAEKRAHPVYRLVHCFVLQALGLLLIALAAEESRAGSGSAAVLFWFSMVLLFVGPIPLLIRRAPRINTQHAAAISMGISFELARVVAFPNRFVQTDELAHVVTLNGIERTHHLFHANSLLPVSPWFPGLEIATHGIEKISGLNSFYSGYVVLCTAHAILLIGIFELVRLASRSQVAAGVAVLIYVTSLQWYFFNAQYSYQSLALPLMVVGFSILAQATRERQFGWQNTSRWVIGSFILISAAFVHHLTSWIGCCLLILWCLLRLVMGQRANSRRLILATSAVLFVNIVWGLHVGQLLLSYLKPVFQADAVGIWDFITGSAPARQLFHTTTGPSTQLWEKAVDVAALALVVGIIPFAAWDGRRWIKEREGLAVLLCVLGSIFPVLLVTRLVPAATETGDRATGFIYLGIAFLFGVWMSGKLNGSRGRRTGVIICIVFLFIGGIAGGNGPDFERLPGPFLLTADARSADSIALAPTYWLAKEFPHGGIPMAADFDDRNLMAAYGNQDLVTNSGDRVQVADIFTSPRISGTDLRLLSKGRIGMLAVDIRMSQYLPQNNVYFELGEPGDGTYTKPLSKASLLKFDSLPRVSRIYDNGYVRIYDVWPIWNR